jgi:hypothetical protein
MKRREENPPTVLPQHRFMAGALRGRAPAVPQETRSPLPRIRRVSYPRACGASFLQNHPGQATLFRDNKLFIL